MQTIVKFYRLSSTTMDHMTIIAEQKINESLAKNLPSDAIVRSVQPQLMLIDGTYHLIITVLIDAPDSVPKERLGFHLGEP